MPQGKGTYGSKRGRPPKKLMSQATKVSAEEQKKRVKPPTLRKNARRK